MTFHFLNKYTLWIAGLAGLFFTACNLTKEVDIQLPEYTVQPVVECYLEPGKPFRLLLTRSYGFFDPLGLDSSFISKTLISDAVVTIGARCEEDVKTT